MQRYTIFFITVNTLHVSGGFSAHHQELKTVHSFWYMSSLLAATASGSSNQAGRIPAILFVGPWIFGNEKK
jgi:hypothetical protein